jgi:DASS family divalent anion:Na+ symporter
MGRRTRWAIVLSIAVMIWLIPHPEGVSADAWRLLAIFAATIIGLIVQPLPLGAMVILAVTSVALLGIVPARTVLTGFANGTVWLIVSAFLLARTFIVTGLGRRIAFLLIRLFGRRTLGLAYALAAADLALAPATPSNTARAGGILYPIVRSLAVALGSEPGDTARKVGAYLIKTEYQVTIITSAMFMTAMAANPLLVELAAQTSDVHLTWGSWALGAILPGLISLAVVPWMLYKIYPPEIKETPAAAQLAQEELEKMGPMTRGEKILLTVFVAILILWATSQLHGIYATTVALVGLSCLLVTNVLSWGDVLGEKGAWDALVWFGGLVMMAGQLNALGLVGWFADEVSGRVSSWPWLVALTALAAIYFYVHYAFASMTAHVTALFPAFLAVAIAAGAPPYLAALIFAYSSNLNGSLTHYATGPSPIYYGSGYIELPTWWKLGLVVSIVNITIWTVVGFPYWKALGLW